MNIVSYAQNFEDVILWRVLQHIPDGMYVDVGAQDPTIDSVSLAFYEHGWRGIHIEPTPRYAEMLRQQRAGDVVIQAAVGATQGTMDFYEIPHTGLSTGVREIAERHLAQRFDVIKTVTPCLTLTQALEPYCDRQIHWLKIDVEGLEHDVIAGWDATRIRPWVLLVESTAPLSSATTYADWEPLVLERGYRFVYFDGLNRFYLANEHPELLEGFSRPPNVFDEFVLGGRASNTFCKALNDRLSRMAEDLTQVHGLVSAKNAELAQTQRQLAAQRGALLEMRQQIAAAEERVAKMLASTSWRLTEPLRRAALAAQRAASAARRVASAGAHAKLALKIRAKPHFLRVARLVAANPAMKAAALRTLRRLPRLHARVVRALGSGQGSGDWIWQGPDRVEALGPVARGVYEDLIAARAARTKTGRNL